MPYGTACDRRVHRHHAQSPSMFLFSFGDHVHRHRARPSLSYNVGCRMEPPDDCKSTARVPREYQATATMVTTYRQGVRHRYGLTPLHLPSPRVCVRCGNDAPRSGGDRRPHSDRRSSSSTATATATATAAHVRARSKVVRRAPSLLAEAAWDFAKGFRGFEPLTLRSSLCAYPFFSFLNRDQTHVFD